MTAFNIVRFRVKPGFDAQLIDEHRKVKEVFPGMRRAALVKTGDRSYCFVGEWDEMEDIAEARDEMIAVLDGFRHMLEDLGGEFGVTDPVSGEVVVDLK